MSQEVIDRATRLVQGFDQRVQSAPADSLDNQSPCENWKARDVVDHVGSNLLGIGQQMKGQEPGEFNPDGDIVAAWNNARDTFLSALPTADMNMSLPGPFGPMPAEQLIGRLISTDVLVHTW